MDRSERQKNAVEQFKKMLGLGIDSSMSSEEVKAAIRAGNDKKRNEAAKAAREETDRAIEAEKRRGAEQFSFFGVKPGETLSVANEPESCGSDIGDIEISLDLGVLDDDGAEVPEHSERVSDGLIISLKKLGRVDIEYISEITNESPSAVISALAGAIYPDPGEWMPGSLDGWKTAEEYLSGNLRKKLEQAKLADERYKGRFRANVEMLSRLVPPYLTHKDIYVTLGSPWVPVKTIKEFIIETFALPVFSSVSVCHDEITGSWEIGRKSDYSGNFVARYTYGTHRINGFEILERTLNMKSVAIYDEVSDPNKKSGKRRTINRPETVLALEKQGKLIEAFRAWVWSDKLRREYLETVYNERFTGSVGRHFDGSFLEFPGMSKDVSLFPYQKNAAARIIFSKNTLLAHDVGSGKTYIMAAAGMKLRQMGLSRKNMYVVPNNIIGQWHAIFHQVYPGADVLCIYPKDFTPAKRKKMLERMRDEDHDAIILTYSSFKLIPLSYECQRSFLRDETANIERARSDNDKLTLKLRKRLEQVEKKLSELALKFDDEDAVYFDSLGVTRLFVDEAHNFKNVPLDTKIDRVLGISSGGSDRCRDMLNKVRLVQRENGGGGVIFSTGTPEITPYL